MFWRRSKLATAIPFFVVGGGGRGGWFRNVNQSATPPLCLFFSYDGSFGNERVVKGGHGFG